MTSPKSKPNSQFNLRALLALIALIATLIAPISYYYRALSNRPKVFATATLMIGAQGYDSAKHVAQLNAVPFRQLVMDSPQLQEVSSLENSPDPIDWLTNHLSVESIDANLIKIEVHGRQKERLGARDLQAIVEATIDLIQTDALKTKTPVTVVYPTTIHP